MNLRGLFGLHKPALTLDTPMSLREFRTILRQIEQPGGDRALRALVRALDAMDDEPQECPAQPEV